MYTYKQVFYTLRKIYGVKVCILNYGIYFNTGYVSFEKMKDKEEKMP